MDSFWVEKIRDTLFPRTADYELIKNDQKSTFITDLKIIEASLVVNPALNWKYIYSASALSVRWLRKNPPPQLFLTCSSRARSQQAGVMEVSHTQSHL